VNPPRLAAALRLVLVAGALFAGGCGPVETPQGAPARAGEWREFSGRFTATGRKHVLGLGGERRASIVDYDGSMLLSGPLRPAVGFRVQAIAFNDSETGMVGRAAWTDERGNQVFSAMHGEGTRTGNKVVGTFLGGTGPYAGATGDYEFSWKFMLETDDGTVQGQALGLKGRVRIGEPPHAPPAEGARP